MSLPHVTLQMPKIASMILSSSLHCLFAVGVFTCGTVALNTFLQPKAQGGEALRPVEVYPGLEPGI